MLQPRRNGKRRKNGKDLTYSPVPGAAGSFWGLVFADYLEDIVTSTEIVTENPNIFFKGTDAVLDYSSVINEDNIEELKVFFHSTVEKGESITIENGEYLDLMNLDQTTYDLGMTATLKNFDEDNLMVFLENVSVNNKSTLTDRYKKEFFLNNLKWTASSSTVVDSIKINEIVNTFGIDSSNSFNSVFGEILPGDQIVLQIDKSINEIFTVIEYKVGSEGEERIAVEEPVPTDSGSDYFGKEVFGILKRKQERILEGFPPTPLYSDEMIGQNQLDWFLWFYLLFTNFPSDATDPTFPGYPDRVSISYDVLGRIISNQWNQDGLNIILDQWGSGSYPLQSSIPSSYDLTISGEPKEGNRSSDANRKWYNVEIDSCSIILPGCSVGSPNFYNDDKPNITYPALGIDDHDDGIGDPEGCLGVLAIEPDVKCDRGGTRQVYAIRNRESGETIRVSGPCCGSTTTSNVLPTGGRRNRTQTIRLANPPTTPNDRSLIEKKHEDWKRSGSITLKTKVRIQNGKRVFAFSGSNQNTSVRPTLLFEAGQTIRINMTDKDLAGQGTHPLSFATVPDGTHRNEDSELDQYIVRSRKKPGERGSYLYYTVPSDPRYTNHYYFCKNHEGMGFKVEVQRAGTQRSNPPAGVGGQYGADVIDTKPSDEDPFIEPDPDIKDSNTCCKGDCRNCLQQAINCVETRGCELSRPVPGDDNGDGIKDPGEDDPYDPLNGCDTDHPSPSTGSRACGPYGIKREYIQTARKSCARNPECCVDIEETYNKLCSKCNGDRACCQEKARLSRLVMECVIRFESRNPDLGKPCDCEGSGGAPAPGLPPSAKKDCLTCEDIAMKQIGSCCHRCLPGDTMPKNKNGEDCCGAGGCRQAIDYWKKVSRYMDFHCPDCRNCSCEKEGDEQVEQRSITTTTPRPTTTTRPIPRTTTSPRSTTTRSSSGGMSSPPPSSPPSGGGGGYSSGY